MAAVLAALTSVVAAVATIWPVVARPSKVMAAPGLEVPKWVVDRPVEVSAVVAALLRRRAGPVGITTGLQGAGGFGKTTLALMVRADRRVRRRFSGHVYLVTVGRDVRGAAAVAAKVNDVIKLVAGEEATFTDPDIAGQRLGALLDTGPRRLLVLDDVWEPEQLAPFAAGGRRCARLVTTRVPGLLAGRGTTVRVDQMSPVQSRVLLTSGLPPLDPALVGGLLAVTGRWPLLLHLVSKILANAAQAGADVGAAGALLLARLEARGPAVVDDLSGEASGTLEVDQPQERARAVRATIGASTSLLDPQDAQRFGELGVFAEDETIPFGLAAQLWRATAGLDDLQASQLCTRLGELALVSLAGTGTGGMALHDVVRDFLRDDLGPQRLAELNGVLLGAVAAGLPTADPLDPAAPGPVRVAWWELDRGQGYMWDHLIEHLLEAGRRSDAEGIACDLRWVGTRLEQSGPAAPAADLSLLDTPRAARLRVAITRAAHLLAPTQPTRAVVDVLHSRAANDPDWGAQVIALRDMCHKPRLVNRWPPPDLPSPALRRVLTGHTRAVTAIAIAPDGSWLVTGGDDGMVRIWDAATGQVRAILTGHIGDVNAVAVAPDGSWLAAGGARGMVRIWDAATGRVRTTLTSHRGGMWATLTGHIGDVRAMAVAPDGSWLVTVSGLLDERVRIWDAATGKERATLTGHIGGVHAVAVAPDGSWLAAGGHDGMVRIWDAATGKERAILTGHIGGVHAVAVAPDGSWLAAGGDDGMVRIWDAATGKERAILTGHIGSVHAVAVAPDGSWLAAAGGRALEDQTVRIWDAATGRVRATLTGTGRVRAVAVAPDGSWLAAVGDDGMVGIWDAATGKERATLTGHIGGVHAVAVAPDGSWLVTGGGREDRTARIWDTATGQERVTLTGHIGGGVRAVAVAPDGSRLVTVSGLSDEKVRIWDAATGRVRATLTGTGSVTAVAVAPDGSWLVTGGGWEEFGERGRVRIWDAATGRVRATLTSHLRYVHTVAVAPDGSWLAAVGARGRARIWDAATGQERATLTGHSGGMWDTLTSHIGYVRAAAVAPDGSWLAVVGARGRARIWDAATGRVRATLTSYLPYVRAVAVAPDGSWLVTVGGREWGDQTVRIWDAATGRVRATLTGTGGVTAVAVAPDGSWLAAGGEDGTIRIWQAVTWQVRALMRVDSGIGACAWLGSDALVVGGSAGLYLFGFLPRTSPPAGQ